jgi:hypothetical protein
MYVFLYGFVREYANYFFGGCVVGEFRERVFDDFCGLVVDEVVVGWEEEDEFGYVGGCEEGRVECGMHGSEGVI